MPIYSSDSDSDHQAYATGRKLFGRERPLHSILGGGPVADVLLWKNKSISAAILVGFTAIWFLFEVVEYNFLTLLCHLSITVMLVIFIWSNGAALFDRTPPRIPEIVLSESAFHHVARTFHIKFNQLLVTLYDIACGKDLTLFLLAIVFLWTLSVIGAYFTTMNLLYMGFLCIGTLPALYERYEHEVDYLVGRGTRDLKKIYKKFDSKVLNKIPRGPVKEKKYK
ncbi:Reticulon-like protein b9 [Thalictrum thalictroides]|uniref:Reticulon-like protein n=1 Tax=Thalictrum thalictroides TaxID=46969 RepID=A0A7J6V981_THATH|nr:Reticulon-like protein b9 [Thalictrum thalictroides]